MIKKFDINNKIDRTITWLIFILCSLGTVIYAVSIVTEIDRIARDLLEDGILPGFVYCLATALGTLRTIKPHLPRWYHFASALVNVLVGYVIVMLWLAIFTGHIDRGAEFIPLLMTLAYLVILRVILIREYFNPPNWLVILVFLITSINIIIPEGHPGVMVIGAMQIVTLLAWLVFLFIGFRWRDRTIN